MKTLESGCLILLFFISIYIMHKLTYINIKQQQMLCFDSASNHIMYMLYDYMYMQEILLSFLNLNILCITIYFITCVLHLCKCCFSVSDECKLNETDETLCWISEKYVGMRPLYIKGFVLCFMNGQCLWCCL